MNILDENGESYFVTAFDHSTQEQGTATSKDAFTSGDINASLTQEVVELREEVAGHGTDQLLYLAGKDGGLVSDDLVDIAVFQDPGIERITLACDTVVEGNDTLLEALYHCQIRMTAAQLQDIDGKAANVNDIGDGMSFQRAELGNGSRKRLGISGHLFLTVDETVGQCYDLLNSDCEEEVVSEEEIRQAISNERVESRVYVEGSRVYLSYERMCEVKAAKRIVSMLLQEGFDEIRDLDEKIDRTEKNLHQRLAPSQRNAVKLCLSYPISIMTGGPGSGKTTTLRFILDIYQAAFPSNEILLAAPTGRASRRMSEQTGKYASTLHSALGLVTEEDSPLNDTEMLSADLIVVDEFSMVDMRLAYVLMERIKPGAQLIIVGDADQLPSVGAGNVLREMIRSEKVPTAVLETVFRQASNSRIITNAHAINHNDTHLQYGDDFQMLEVQNSEEAARLVIKNYLREVAIHGIENVQILSPFRKRGAVASNALNETIRELVNPPNNLKKEMKCGSRVFRVGDRIMQTVNRINVSNGDVGIITDVETEDDDTIARVKLLDGRELSYTQEMLEDLEFSYCTTIHKSQGQEYPVIIVPLLKEHYIMLRQNLLYTAVTRAKAKVILIGQKQAVFIAIHKCDVGQRNTVLADRIVAYYNRELSNQVT